MSGFFRDIDAIWENKQVEFISGKHKGRVGVCKGFRNAYSGAGLRVDFDNDESIMVHSYQMDDIRIIKNNKQ